MLARRLSARVLALDLKRITDDTTIVDALMAVLDFHQPRLSSTGPVCQGCADADDVFAPLVEWPCMTVLHIAETLDVEL